MKRIPERAADRLEIGRKIRRQAHEFGLRDEDLYIDCLVKTRQCRAGTGNGNHKSAADG
jgi:hypothetical protein